MAAKRPPHVKAPEYLSKSPPLPDPGPAVETEDVKALTACIDYVVEKI